MTKFEEKVSKGIDTNNGVLFEFLGADNVERIKTEITNAIINQVIDDLRNNDEYLIDSDEITRDIVDSVVSEAKEKIRPQLEKILYEKAIAKLGIDI